GPDEKGGVPLGSALEVVTPESPAPPETPEAGVQSPEAGSAPPGEVPPSPELEQPTGAATTSTVQPPEVPAGAGAPQGRGERRPGRYGINVQFESREGDPELGRLVESTVWVNEAHPAYRRAVASRSEGYHVALAAALALATLAVEPAKEHPFVTAFLASWGDAL